MLDLVQLGQPASRTRRLLLRLCLLAILRRPPAAPVVSAGRCRRAAGASAPGSGRQGPLWACGRPGPRLGGGLRGIWGRGGRPSLFLADRSGPSGRRRSQFARRPVHPVLAGPDRRGEPSRLPGVGRAPRGRAGPTVVLIGRRRRPGRPDRRAGPRRPDGPRTCPARPLGRHLPLPPPGCRARWGLLALGVGTASAQEAPPTPRPGSAAPPPRRCGSLPTAGSCPGWSGAAAVRPAPAAPAPPSRPAAPAAPAGSGPACRGWHRPTSRSRPGAAGPAPARRARPRPRPGRLGRHRLDRSLRRHRVDRNPHRHRVDWALRRYRGRPGPPLARTTRS
jgi:hypothetical protein